MILNSLSYNVSNVQSFPLINIMELGIETTNKLLQEKKDFFQKFVTEKEKIKIFFMDSNLGLRKIETDIWILSDKAIILQENRFIPIANIVGVESSCNNKIL